MKAAREQVRRVRALQLEEKWRRVIDELDAENDQRAVRRARSMIRRMCREFGLCRMWTLTYAGDGCHDRSVLVAHLEAFAREFKARFPQVIWLAVPELHPGTDEMPSHGWHVHVAVSSFIPFRRFNECWPHGHTETPKGTDGKPLAGKIDATVTAQYLCKYVAKSLGEGREYLGQHRYFRPKGLEVSVEEAGGGAIYGVDEARRVAIAYFGGLKPTYEFESDEVESWSGPPVVCLDFWPERRRRSPAGGQDGT
jgi:hypothetical protein